MKLVISAHFDIARPVMWIKMEGGAVRGLVDNFAGLFVAYQAGRMTDVPVYFTNYEELEYDGAIKLSNYISRDHTVIVVDTIKKDNSGGKNASIANCYGMELKVIKRSFDRRIHFIDGEFESTEDETWIYGRKFGFKTLYFGVPIPRDYHDTNNSIELDEIDKATEILVDLIQWLRAR